MNLQQKSTEAKIASIDSSIPTRTNEHQSINAIDRPKNNNHQKGLIYVFLTDGEVKIKTSRAWNKTHSKTANIPQ